MELRIVIRLFAKENPGVALFRQSGIPHHGEHLEAVETDGTMQGPWRELDLRALGDRDRAKPRLAVVKLDRAVAADAEIGFIGKPVNIRASRMHAIRPRFPVIDLKKCKPHITNQSCSHPMGSPNCPAGLYGPMSTESIALPQTGGSKRRLWIWDCHRKILSRGARDGRAIGPGPLKSAYSSLRVRIAPWIPSQRST